MTDRHDPSIDHERIDDLIALAALGELSDSEREELGRAASTDDAVAAELAEALDVAAALQGDHDEVAPVGLRSSVLDAIAAEPQEPPMPAETEPRPGVVDLAVRRRRRFASVLAAAAAAVIVVGAAIVVLPGGDSDPIEAVVDADDAVVRRLDGSLSGTLDVVHSPTEGAIVVAGADLAPLTDDETLQLWLIVDQDAQSVGIFRPDDDGSVSVRFDGVDPTDVVLGVTIEPAPGSASPTLPVVASA